MLNLAPDMGLAQREVSGWLILSLPRLSSGFRPLWLLGWKLWLILAHKLLSPAIYRLDAYASLN